MDAKLLTHVVPMLAKDIEIEDWDKIRKIKNNFIQKGFDDDLNTIPPIVLDSWKRSNKYNVNGEIKVLSKSMLQNVLTTDNIMINAIEALLTTTRSQYLQHHTGYYLTLLNKNGLMIFAAGSVETKKYFEKLNLIPGAMLSEDQIGTTAHTIALKTGQLVQLIGPHNYSNVFDNCILTAVPIWSSDEKEVIGVFQVIQHDVPESAIPFTVNIFGMAASVASIISGHMRIYEEQNKLNLIKSFMNINTFPGDENKGIIIINTDDDIIYTNNTASLWINYQDDMRHVSNYILNYNAIKKYLHQNKQLPNIKIELENCDLGDTVFNAAIHPIKNTEANKPKGNIIYINALSGTTPISGVRYTFDSIIGKHHSIKKLKTVATNIAATKNNVLILGESGTGKEVLAQAIHNGSGVHGPFVAINCASIPKTLIETELFGYVGGAFTDADKSGKQGKIEFANNGTIFLDEIGDMPIELQPVLLRVLEEKQVVRIGGKEPIHVNFRVISATNADLYEKVLKKEFREDLYFRLAVITIDIPPLRDRGSDILLLAEHFIRKACRNNNKTGITLSDNVKDILLNYHWQGNIRQLESTMISAVCSIDSYEEIETYHLPKIIREHNEKEKADGSLENTAITIIKDTIAACGGNINEASKKLGISRATIYRKLKAASEVLR